jgi:ABC-type sugar transport system ATPase subunit
MSNAAGKGNCAANFRSNLSVDLKPTCPTFNEHSLRKQLRELPRLEIQTVSRVKVFSLGISARQLVEIAESWQRKKL